MNRPMKEKLTLQAVVQRPATVFVCLSLIFGALSIWANPPLRGPDEIAHFVRAYGISQGVLVPATVVRGRMGTYMPAHLYADFAIFRDAERTFGGGDFRYHEVFFEWRQSRARQTDAGDDHQRVFVPYEGSEGYSPVTYLPYSLAAWAGGAAGLDFMWMSYLMRAAGLVAMTLVLAYAIHATPWLKWAFFMIAMLPAALYGRSAIGADGGTLAFTMVVVALCLRAVHRSRSSAGALRRSLWMTLAILAKPSQIVFALMELITGRFRSLPRRFRSLALVTLPGLLLGPVWVLMISGELATWRIVEGTGRPAEEFDPLWKLGFMLQNPLYFPRMFASTLVGQLGGLWQQAIGVLGRLDTPLRWWAYPLLSGLLLMTWVERLEIDRETRVRLICVNAGLIAVYTVFVYLILFMTWTPLNVDVIWGVQGRYFLMVLPSAAIVVALWVCRDLGHAARGAAAIIGGIVSGVTTTDALLRVNW
jgi:uncharacterized membrane protein